MSACRGRGSVSRGLTCSCCRAGFAFVKMIGAVGGFVGPSLIGLLAVAEDNYAGSMAVLACCLLLGGAMCLAFVEPGERLSSPHTLHREQPWVTTATGLDRVFRYAMEVHMRACHGAAQAAVPL